MKTWIMPVAMAQKFVANEYVSQAEHYLANKE